MLANVSTGENPNPSVRGGGESTSPGGETLIPQVLISGRNLRLTERAGMAPTSLLDNIHATERLRMAARDLNGNLVQNIAPTQTPASTPTSVRSPISPITLETERVRSEFYANPENKENAQKYYDFTRDRFEFWRAQREAFQEQYPSQEAPPRIFNHEKYWEKEYEKAKEMRGATWVGGFSRGFDIRKNPLSLHYHSSDQPSDISSDSSSILDDVDNILKAEAIDVHGRRTSLAPPDWERSPAATPPLPPPPTFDRRRPLPTPPPLSVTPPTPPLSVTPPTSVRRTPPLPPPQTPLTPDSAEARRVIMAELQSEHAKVLDLIVDGTEKGLLRTPQGREIIEREGDLRRRIASLDAAAVAATSPLSSRPPLPSAITETLDWAKKSRVQELIDTTSFASALHKSPFRPPPSPQGEGVSPGGQNIIDSATLKQVLIEDVQEVEAGYRSALDEEFMDLRGEYGFDERFTQQLGNQTARMLGVAGRIGSDILTQLAFGLPVAVGGQIGGEIGRSITGGNLGQLSGSIVGASLARVAANAFAEYTTAVGGGLLETASTEGLGVAIGNFLELAIGSAGVNSLNAAMVAAESFVSSQLIPAAMAVGSMATGAIPIFGEFGGIAAVSSSLGVSATVATGGLVAAAAAAVALIGYGASRVYKSWLKQQPAPESNFPSDLMGMALAGGMPGMPVIQMMDFVRPGTVSGMLDFVRPGTVSEMKNESSASSIADYLSAPPGAGAQGALGGSSGSGGGGGGGGGGGAGGGGEIDYPQEFINGPIGRQIISAMEKVVPYWLGGQVPFDTTGPAAKKLQKQPEPIGGKKKRKKRVMRGGVSKRPRGGGGRGGGGISSANLRRVGQYLQSRRG